MKEWTCSTCDKSFDTEAGCARHIEQKHTKSGKGGRPVWNDMDEDFGGGALADAAAEMGFGEYYDATGVMPGDK